MRPLALVTLLAACGPHPPPEAATPTDTPAPEAEGAQAVQEAAQAPAAAPRPAPPPANCDEPGLQEALTAIAAAEPEQRRDLLVTGVATACGHEGFVHATSRAEGAQRAMALASWVTHNKPVWQAGCAEGVEVFAQVADVPPDERPAALYERCDLARFGWTPEQWEATGGELNMVVAAGLITGVSADLRERLLAALAE